MAANRGTVLAENSLLAGNLQGIFPKLTCFGSVGRQISACGAICYGAFPWSAEQGISRELLSDSVEPAEPFLVGPVQGQCTGHEKLQGDLRQQDTIGDGALDTG